MWLTVIGRFGTIVRIVTNRDLWRMMMWPVFLGTYCRILCMMLRLTYTKAAVAGSLLALTPVFMVPFAIILLGERFDKRVLAGTLIAVAGAIAVGL